MALHAFMLSHSFMSNIFVTPWTIAHQAPLSIELSRQEYWSRLPFLTQVIFLTHGSNPLLLGLLHWQVDSLTLHHLGSPSEILCVCVLVTLCDSMDCRPPDLSAHGILQARILEWVVIKKKKKKCFCCRSVAQSCQTLCNSMDCSRPRFPVLHHLLGFLQLMSIESMMPSYHLILCHLLLLLPTIFPSIGVFPIKSDLRIMWPKY